ncbi:MAG TPA: hypothetical protein PKY82_02685 [Pyrinomonadaceae bacterium]|nr:hypothetical protein [Pyrinomonadaceae bacterium]
MNIISNKNWLFFPFIILILFVSGCAFFARIGETIRPIFPERKKDVSKTPEYPSGSCLKTSVAELRKGVAADDGNYYWDRFKNNKCLEVSGTIVSNGSDFVILDSNQSGRGQGVVFRFQQDRISDLSSLQIGQNISVQGKCCETYSRESGRFYVVFHHSAIVR